MNRKKIINRLSRVGIIGNVLLCSFKLAAGILGHSGAMVSDAIHSLSDVFATFIAWIGSILSERSADETHPYGHERFECIAAMFLGFILALTGIGIGYAGFRNILSGAYRELPLPTLLPLSAAVISIVVKEGMFWYTLHYAKLLNSDAFKADAWHHRSDALSSVGSFIGIAASILGFPIMDSIASLVICVFILKVALDVVKDSLDKMLDKACDPEFNASLHNFIAAQEGVIHIDVMQTRMFGSRVYVDVEIAVNKDLSLIAAHEIADRVHNGVEQNYPSVKHIMIHVNPFLG